MAPVGPRKPAERGTMSRIPGKDSTDSTTAYAGIDVCKAWLDIHLLAGDRDEAFRVANTRAGIAELLGRLAGVTVSRAALAATGRMHPAVWQGLHAAGIPVVVPNPHRARTFADALGLLARPVPGPIGEPTPSTPGCWR